MGRYALADKVEAKESSIVVAGKEIEIYAEKNPENLPWSKLDIDVDCCRPFNTSVCTYIILSIVPPLLHLN